MHWHIVKIALITLNMMLSSFIMCPSKKDVESRELTDIGDRSKIWS